jgi:hypothetical protein
MLTLPCDQGSLAYSHALPSVLPGNGDATADSERVSASAVALHVGFQNIKVYMENSYVDLLGIRFGSGRIYKAVKRNRKWN